MAEKRIDEDKLTEAHCDSTETCKPAPKKGISEDWLSLILGLLIFVLSLGVFGGLDILGWGASTKVWTDPAKAISPVSKYFQTVKGEITKIDGQKVTLKKADGNEETVTVKEDTSGLAVGSTYEKKGVSTAATSRPLLSLWALCWALRRHNPSALQAISCSEGSALSLKPI
jgi:hypothetical protein